ncbi:MAG: endonuclease/exonuclease/phosphatase family protein [Hyphomonas sp.]
MPAWRSTTSTCPPAASGPTPPTNDKFAHKLDFLERLGPAYKKQTKTPRVLVGDLNVAPHENDVWSHKQLLKIVSHTPEETERLESSRNLAKFADVARLAVPDEQKLYTWWSYRAKDWAESNRGRRLDHIWVNPAALPDTKVDSYRIHLGWRGGWKPSDHAPVSIEIKV